MKRLLMWLAVCSAMGVNAKEDYPAGSVDQEAAIISAMDLDDGLGNEERGKAMDDEVGKYMENGQDHKIFREDEVLKPGKKKNNTALLRAPAIKETGLSFGSQAGLHWRYSQINQLIESKYRGRLDQINFRPFMLEGRILTPSVLIAKNTEEYLSDTKSVETKISFIVDDEARLVSVPPTYRNYLIRYYDKPKPVHYVLKPTSAAEEKIWRIAVREGFAIGVNMADQIFNDGLLKMERDIEGRVNYRKMVQLGMISPAALKVTERNVTFNGRQMNVGETIFEITNNAGFRSMDEWRSAWLKSEERLNDESQKDNMETSADE